MSDGDPIKSFLYEIGFTNDSSGAAKVDAAAKQLEAKLAATAEAGAAKRAEAGTAAEAKIEAAAQKRASTVVEAERLSAEERVAILQRTVLQALGIEDEMADKIVKHQKERSADSINVEKEHAKKASVIRNMQFKELEAGLLRFTSLSQVVSSGVSGLLSAAPFGAFLVGVERTATGLSRMSVQAQRVGASVAGIERFKFALRQQGVDEGEATGALEGFSKTIQSNPKGYRQVLERMGVRTKDKNGIDLSNDELLEGFGAHLATLPLNQARIQAGQLGVTGDNAINALRQPAETHKGLNAYDAKLKAFGYDPDKAAEDARKVDQAYTNLEADLKIVNTKLQAEFFVPMMNGFDALARKIEANPQVVENYGRALEALAALATARVLPTLANLAVKFTGLQAILGTSLGTALSIAVNPVVALGASAESTPAAPVTTDPAERARKLKDNTLPAAEMTPEEREAFSKAHGGGLWDWIKGKLGFGGSSDDTKVKADIAATAEGVKKLADKADLESGGLGSGGSGAMGRASGYIGKVLNHFGRTAFHGKGHFGDKGWWTPDRQSHAVDSLMKNAGLTEDGAKALVSRWKFVESAGGPTSVNPTSGAEGIAQWLGSRKGNGSNGTFDEQLAKVARELNGQDRDDNRLAKRLLNTPGREAEGASAYERAEGYAKGANAGTHRDNYTDRVAEGMKHIVHGNQPTVYVNGTPSSSDAPVGDQAALDAQNRIIAGKGRAGDRALIDRHRQEQNAPAAAAPAPKPESDRNADGSLKLTARTLGRYIGVTRPMAAKGQMPHPHEIGPYHGPTKVEVVKSNLDPAHQKLAEAMRAAAVKPVPKLPDRTKAYEAISRMTKDGTLHSFLNLHLGSHQLVSSHVLNSIHHGNRSHTFNREGDTFHVHGSDPKTALNEAHKVSARRDAQDRIRYMQGNQQ